VSVLKNLTNLERGEAQIDAPAGTATDTVRKSAGQKCYLGRYIYSAGRSVWQKNKTNTCTNNYPFLQPKFRASIGGEYGLTRKLLL
jgi:hypothetical protein